MESTFPRRPQAFDQEAQSDGCHPPSTRTYTLDGEKSLKKTYKRPFPPNSLQLLLDPSWGQQHPPLTIFSFSALLPSSSSASPAGPSTRAPAAKMLNERPRSSPVGSPRAAGEQTDTKQRKAGEKNCVPKGGTCLGSTFRKEQGDLTRLLLWVWPLPGLLYPVLGCSEESPTLVPIPRLERPIGSFAWCSALSEGLSGVSTGLGGKVLTRIPSSHCQVDMLHRAGPAPSPASLVSHTWAMHKWNGASPLSRTSPDPPTHWPST